MKSNWIATLDFLQGPVFRFAFAVMFLGVMRWAILAVSDSFAARFAIADADERARKLRWRVMWFLMPAAVFRQAYPHRARFYAYDTLLGALSLGFRTLAVMLPAFMAVHVYLWEQWLGIGWPALPEGTADALALLTIVAGFGVFLGGLYSPMLRACDPWWAFLKPLLLITPFALGFLIANPNWNPIDYHVARVLHVGSACLVLILLPFARLLSPVHARLDEVIPEARWLKPAPSASHAAPMGHGV